MFGSPPSPDVKDHLAICCGSDRRGPAVLSSNTTPPPQFFLSRLARQVFPVCLVSSSRSSRTGTVFRNSFEVRTLSRSKGPLLLAYCTFRVLTTYFRMLKFTETDQGSPSRNWEFPRPFLQDCLFFRFTLHFLSPPLPPFFSL